MAEARTSRLLVEAFDAPQGRTPIWLMRQAGRYLPEYRELRAKAGSFLDLCYTPELAAEVTLQPIRRFGFDAAILFSDILVIPDALGRSVRFNPGEGPMLDPILAEDIDTLAVEGANDRLEPVFETVERVRAALPAETTLIGFCGAPWTVATYMIAGRGTTDQAPARLFAARDPAAMDRLIDRLTDASAAYLLRQLQAGADVVQIFDSWSGVLAEDQFERWSIRPAAKMVREIKARFPAAKVIGFPKGAGQFAERYMRETGVDGIGVDWTMPLHAARETLQPLGLVQGNLDPMALVAGGAALDAGIDRIMEELSVGRLIFNLGHGIVPETPIAHVERLVERVRSWQGATR